jgi:hypothetical protein
VGTFLADRADGVALVVMRRIDQRFIRQFQQTAENRFILRARIAVLQIGPPRAADQQGIAREHAIAEQEAVGIIGVPRRVDDIQRQPLDLQLVSIRYAHGNHVHLALLAHHRDAVRAIAQCAEAGDVIGVQMRIHRLHQIEIEFSQQMQVAIHFLQYRIDDERVPAAAAGQEVGVGA